MVEACKQFVMFLEIKQGRDNSLQSDDVGVTTRNSTLIRLVEWQLFDSHEKLRRLIKNMKRYSGIILTLCLGLLLAAPFLGASPKQANAQSFSGEIMDSLCAKDGSHEKMMEEMKSMGRDKKTCTIKCIQLGAKYVLYDNSKHTAYVLDDQDKAEAFAGQTVNVLGTLEKSKLKIESIEPAGGQGQ